MRPRSAPHSATISKRRSIRKRRCAGAGRRSIRPIRNCRKASNRSTKYVTAPQELERRLRQIGLVERGRGARAWSTLLKPGQRLVSRDGDLWRWDGFAVAANAPTGAARRLAERNRLAEIEAELQTRACRSRNQAPGRDRRRGRSWRPRAEAEAAARTRWRELQREPTARASVTPAPSASSTSRPRGFRRLTEAKTRLERQPRRSAGRTRRGDERACRELPAARRTRRQARDGARRDQRRTASGSPKCAPRRRRWRARPRSPRSGWTRSPASSSAWIETKERTANADRDARNAR